MGCSKSSSKRKVYSNKDHHQEIRKISNKQPTLPSKGIRKRTNKAQSQKKEGNNKDQRGNKIETKKKIEKSMKANLFLKR